MMTMELKWKPDFDLTVRRFEAWWVGQMIDRPPITCSVKPARPYRGPDKQHDTLRQRWLDVTYNVERQIAELERTDFVGDRLPILLPNVGPELTATLLGCELEFSDHSSWSVPIISDIEQWRDIPRRPLDFDNIYWQTIVHMTDLALEMCDGRYMVGVADLHDNYDTLAALRDPQQLCMDLIDCPDLIEQAGRATTRVLIEAFGRLWQRIEPTGFGCTTWCPIHHSGPAYVPSCDFWCMVGPEVACDFVLPDILTEMTILERSIFHLDGPDALRHLDLLLEIPQLNAVQWVFGAGNGPASKWLGVYRRVLDAGKSVQVLADDADDALNVLKQLGGKGLWLLVNQTFDTTAETQAFLRQVESECAHDCGSQPR